MKHILVLLALVALSLSCVTTPQPVIHGQDMAIEAITSVEIDVTNAIDSYNVEVKALVAEKYAKEFALTEATLLSRSADGQSVTLSEYKEYANKFAAEIAAANAFYDDLAAQVHAKVGYKFGVAKNLSLAVQAYNKAAGLDPETFQQLLDSTGSAASAVIDAYGAESLKKANSRQPDWKEVLSLAAKNKMKDLPNLGGNPDAAWRNWLSTGKLPSLQDLVTSKIPAAREAIKGALTPPQPPATPLGDIPSTTTIVTPSN